MRYRLPASLLNTLRRDLTPTQRAQALHTQLKAQIKALDELDDLPCFADLLAALDQELAD